MKLLGLTISRSKKIDEDLTEGLFHEDGSVNQIGIAKAMINVRQHLERLDVKLTIIGLVLVVLEATQHPWVQAILRVGIIAFTHTFAGGSAIAAPIGGIHATY